MKGEPIIRFAGVEKAFGPKVICAGVDLDVWEGETLVILGGSGVGKSVLLKMLIGLIPYDRGSITFRGREVSSMTSEELRLHRRAVAMIFQASALFDSLSVGDNVAYGLHEHHAKELGADELGERVRWALGRVGLPGIEAMRIADLSGGMKRRVGLARAIALRPEVILWDEPTTGLDPINTARINHLVHAMKDSLHATNVVVTHDMKSAFEIADRIAMLRGGRVVLEGGKEVFLASKDPHVRGFIDGVAPEEESVEALLTS